MSASFYSIESACPAKRASLKRRSALVFEGLQQSTLAQIERCFAGVLPEELFGQNPFGDFSRDRVYPLSRVLWGWIWQVLQGNTACREVVRQVQALFALHDAGPVDESTSGYCTARGKVTDCCLQKFFSASASSAEKAAPAPKKTLLCGRRLRVVDGSGARLDNTTKNRAAFAPSSNVARGGGVPYMRVVIVFSLLSGAILAQATGSLCVGELRLWLRLLSTLKPGDILLGDGAYGCYGAVVHLKRRGIDLLSTVRVRTRKVDFRKAKKRLGPGDALFMWRKPKTRSALFGKKAWERVPKEVEVRLLRARVKRWGFRTEHFVIVTTLLDAELYPASEIIAVHARRWRVEMCLDDLKTTLGMEHMSCLSPRMVKKELLVFLIAHNLVRWMIASAAAQEDADIERLSFKGTLDGFRQWSQAMAQCNGSGPLREKLWKAFLHNVAADKVPLRPGRSEPRAVKRRSKYPYLKGLRRSCPQKWSRSKRHRIARAKRKAASLI